MNGFTFDTGFFLHEIIVGIRYVPMVLLLSLAPLLAGLGLGLLVAIVRVLKLPVLSQVFTVLVVFIRGIPIVLILTISYLLANMEAGSSGVSYPVVAVFGLSLSAIAYLSESLRSALESVQAGQFEAARSVGLSSAQMFRRVIVPQALPVAIPLVGNNLIGLIKGSSVVSVITVVEIMGGTLLEATRSYQFLEAYLAAAVVYWALCFATERLTALAESRVARY
jgi:His/Glu/Gln/Arg/opine family amino acid ABC transporter permease subunit